MSNFNVNLKKIREKKGLTAKEVAIDLGIPYTTYLKYEGVGEPRYDTLIKIADYLNVSIDELLGYTPNEYEKTKEFLESLGITVSENIYIENGLMANIIQIVYPIDKAPQIKEASLRSFSFGSRIEFVNFINNASQEIIENNIVDYIVDYVVKTDRKIYEEFARQCELYIKENPNDKKFIEFYERTKPISLGLKFPEANKKNPPPSEAGEGLKG